jgi:hypothetical protein
MAVYTEILSDDDEDAGIHERDLITAIQVWTWMQDSATPQTVAATALAFNTTPDIVRKAVRDAYWMFLVPDREDDPIKQTIEHDGD